MSNSISNRLVGFHLYVEDRRMKSRIADLEAKLSEIVRVARDNPDGLVEYIKDNYSKEWGQQ